MFASINETEIYFDVEGPGLAVSGDTLRDRPVVLALHGGPGGDHASLRTTLAPLADVAQIVYIDHRGSGRSAPADPKTYTLEQNVADLEGLRAHLGLERVVVLGVSYGGMVAQGYALRYPQQLAALVLAVTAPSHRFLPAARAIVEARGSAEQRRVCEWLWNASFSSDEQLEEYYRLMGPMYSTTFDPDKFAHAWKLGTRNFEQLNLGFGGFLREFDFEPDLHKISCPTLVIAGAHDWICPPAQAHRIAARIPRAHLHVFPASAHAVAADEPEAFYRVVAGFLTHLESN